MVPFVAAVLPVLETLVGCCLVLGLLTRGAALLALGLSAIFAGAIASALTRGLEIGCGCFGDESQATWQHVGLNLFLVVVSTLLVSRGGGRWTIENRFAERAER